MFFQTRCVFQLQPSFINVDEFEDIYAFVRDELKPDSLISEVAEERVALYHTIPS